MGKSDKRGKRKTVGYVNIIGFAALVVVMAVFWATCYTLVTDKVIETAVQNMEELARHDEQSVASTLNDRWDTLRGIATHLKTKQCASEDALAMELDSCKPMLECLRLTLVADDGYTVNSSMKYGYDEALLDSCAAAGGQFIRQMENAGSDADGIGEFLLCGTEIEPFSVQGRAYTYIVCRMDVDTFQDNLKIDCYDGRGYSSVIDAEGHYIASIERSYTAQKIGNFFDVLAAGQLPREYPLARIRQLVEDQQSFTFEYTSAEGEERVVVFDPFPEIDWFFVTAVPKAVFQEQGQSLTLLVSAIVSIMLVALLAVVVAVFRRRSKVYRLEVQHREELANALAMAESANRAKTTFLNNMSHDIRTPMNAIIGFTALATAHINETERVAGYLEKIGRSSSHLLSLINDILDMSRIESGKMSLDEKPEDLAEILHDLRDIIQADIYTKQIEFFIDTVDVTDEAICCDRLRLNQILLNVLSNAIKFTDPGGTISVRIAERKSARAGYGTYEFRVKDTGIGMSEEFIQTIFEPFTRERTSTVSGIQGTGLGMAITKNIVDLMGGTISVKSKEGKGTEFIITLDFLLQSEQQRDGPIEQLQGLRGLVADDNMGTCQSVTAMLRQIGMRSEWTVHGREAVVRAKEAVQIGDPFHVYIIDWKMPDMNGVETARRIRQVVGDDAPIIILSAYDWAEIEEEARAAGVTDFVSKPLFQSDLRRVLLRACGEPSDRHEAQPEPRVSFNGERLLLAEDNELNQEIATAVLEEAGFAVDCAGDGREAVDKVARAAPGYYQAVLMDIQMPVMDGYEATRRIRGLSDPALASIPIIAMTANAFDEDRQMALDAGMNAHVGKPIDIPVLLDTLKQVLEHKN